MENLMSFLSVHQTQGQDLSTLSPAILFESMFQNSDDTAIQEDPQQTGLLYKLFSWEREFTIVDTINNRHSEILFQFL